MAALEAEHFLAQHGADVDPGIPEAQWEPVEARNNSKDFTANGSSPQKQQSEAALLR